MRALASSLHAWRAIEKNEGVHEPHGLVFPLAVVAAIGQPHGLVVVDEDEAGGKPEGFDAVFITVLDARCMMDAAAHFRRWHMPMRRLERCSTGPLVWAGGQGLHNPMPFYDIADLIVVGDAEDPLPVLLDMWERHGNSVGFLAAAATVPGVLVPAHHAPGETEIVQSVSQDVAVTLRHHLDVSHNGTRRIEIARGCRYKCAFCSLGWRAPYRENDASAICAAIAASGKVVHLQAGDAESHSGIAQIHEAVKARGAYDQGWTSRLDSLYEQRPDTISGKKRYAFGVEGVTYRLRRAVGKGYLTDDALVESTHAFFEQVGGDHCGRGMWHMIAGLPTEQTRDALGLGRVIQRLDDRRRGRVRRNLAVHWQPFAPLPGTPMQWCATGGGTRKLSGLVASMTDDLKWVRTSHVAGRTNDVARICTILARSDRRGAELLDALGSGRIVEPDDAERIAGVTAGKLDPDAPLPWDWIRYAYDRPGLRRAHEVVRRRLVEQ